MSRYSALELEMIRKAAKMKPRYVMSDGSFGPSDFPEINAEVDAVQTGALPGFAAQSPTARRIAQEQAARGQNPYRQAQQAQLRQQYAVDPARLRAANEQLAMSRRVGESDQAFRARMEGAGIDLADVPTQPYIAPKPPGSPVAGTARNTREQALARLDERRRQQAAARGQQTWSPTALTPDQAEELSSRQRSVRQEKPQPVRLNIPHEEFIANPEAVPVPAGGIATTSEGLAYRNDTEMGGGYTPMVFDPVRNDMVPLESHLDRLARSDKDGTLARKYADLKRAKLAVFNDNIDDTQQRDVIGQIDREMFGLARGAGLPSQEEESGPKVRTVNGITFYDDGSGKYKPVEDGNAVRNKLIAQFVPIVAKWMTQDAEATPDPKKVMEAVMGMVNEIMGGGSDNVPHGTSFSAPGSISDADRIEFRNQQYAAILAENSALTNEQVAEEYMRRVTGK